MTSQYASVEEHVLTTDNLFQIVCNFTNAIFFWAIQPETAKRPLEEMNYLFTNAPIFVPTMNMRDFEQHDLENRVAEVERKGSINSHVKEKI